MSIKPTLVMLDEQLISIEGHHYEYIRSIKQIYEERGHKVLVYGNAQVVSNIVQTVQAKPWFKFDAAPWYRKIPVLGAIAYRLIFWNLLHKQYRAAIDDVLSKEKSNVHFFVPNIYWFNAMPVFKAFKAVSHKSSFLLRSSVVELFDVPANFRGLVKRMYKGVAKLVQSNAVLQLVTDSDVIKDEWQFAFGNPVRTLPIPHVEAIATNETSKDVNERLVFYAPGVMRIEKGMPLIESALLHIDSNEKTLAQRIKFVVQIFGEREKAYFDTCRTQLTKLQHVQVEILGSLSSEAYHDAVANADIILIPYQAKQGYKARTSGVLCEAIGACKPVITSKHTWMQVECEQYNTGVAVDEDVMSLVEGMQQVVDNYDTFKQQAVVAQKAFLDFHSKANFYALLG
jgi:glycosyltransferase involved in cell wall biosynthesis